MNFVDAANAAMELGFTILMNQFVVRFFNFSVARQKQRWQGLENFIPVQEQYVSSLQVWLFYCHF